jgi:hypothetical protein
MNRVIGVDPGKSGAFVLWDGQDLNHFPMPLKEKEIDFQGVVELVGKLKECHFFLERAYPGGMGVTAAFNYGRGFAAIEHAIQIHKIPVTYVEPSKWAKIMHEGIDAELKPKAKSRIAVERLFPVQVNNIPRTKTGKFHEGVVDALLIAEYGRRITLSRAC